MPPDRQISTGAREIGSPPALAGASTSPLSVEPVGGGLPTLKTYGPAGRRLLSVPEISALGPPSSQRAALE